MQQSLLPILALAFLATASCSATPEPPRRPPEANRMQEGFAPTPYAADEIRANCEPGRTMVLRVGVPEQPTVHQVLHFTREDDGTPLFQAWTTTVDGDMIGEIASVKPVWRELQGHASFPEERTSLELRDVTLPLGTLSCWIYTVRSEREGVSHVMRFHFDRQRPGPPILMEIEQGGESIYRMTMIEDDSASSGG